MEKISNQELICSDINKAADIIIEIGESASVSWTKEYLIEWLQSDSVMNEKIERIQNIPGKHIDENMKKKCQKAETGG